MAIIDRDGRVVSANDALGALLGAAADSLVSTSLTDLPSLGLDGSTLRSAFDPAATPSRERAPARGAGTAAARAAPARRRSAA